MVTKFELFSILKEDKFFKFCQKKCKERLKSHIFEKFNISECPKDDEERLNTTLKLFLSKLISKWKSSKQIYNKFVKKNSQWLNAELCLPITAPADRQLPILQTATASELRGRPKKLFSDSSNRTKRRKVDSFIRNVSPNKLIFAAEQGLRKHGKRIAADVVHLAGSSSQKSLKKMKEAPTTSSIITPYTPEEALALIIDSDLTKYDYINIQTGAKARNANIYPSYPVISETKKKCYPENISVTEKVAEIPLQDLLDHTVRRLFEVQLEVLEQHLPAEIDTINVIYKWGIDGSGGHSIYKQNFSDHSLYGDSNIVLCTLVPLEMSTGEKDNRKIYWKNLSTSSLKYCRPLCFKLAKETPHTVKEEVSKIDEQIVNLNLTSVKLSNEKLIYFKHKLVCTMVDGKTVNILTETASTQSCNICKATPKDMNNLASVQKRQPCEDSYKYGISILHAYLRSFEYLLNISYKLSIKQWQARSKDSKYSVSLRKADITKKFYDQMGLVVDQPKQGGGNSNDGNTARRFFANTDIVSEITGLDERILIRFSTILSTLSSCHYIQIEQFKKYCIETAKLVLQIYGWYRMSATVHKILIHGADIIKSLPLPAGQFSEDVIEASHKAYKNIRLFHSRKTSRINTNTDIMHMLLLTSDPVISAIRKNKKHKSTPFSPQVISMLDIPEFLKDISMRNDDVDDSDNETETEDEITHE